MFVLAEYVTKESSYFFPFAVHVHEIFLSCRTFFFSRRQDSDSKKKVAFQWLSENFVMYLTAYVLWQVARYQKERQDFHTKKQLSDAWEGKVRGQGI